MKALIALALAAVTPVEVQTVTVTPSSADPQVRQFDIPSIAVTRPDLMPDAPLVVFLSGSYGRPAGARAILSTVSDLGYRGIALEYNDAPAVLQVCARDPDPACSANFREVRSFGTGRFPQQPNPAAEAIVPRLVSALRWLAAKHPKAGWDAYLDGDQPRWDRLVLSGLSQGAGMAAFIAKRHAVARVVLFSSPWDFTGANRLPAPWLATPSATPADRWYASYHARENAVRLILPAYAALGIPKEHIHVFNLDLPTGAKTNGPNPYHPIGIRDGRYLADWQAMFGHAP